MDKYSNTYIYWTLLVWGISSIIINYCTKSRNGFNDLILTLLTTLFHKETLAPLLKIVLGETAIMRTAQREFAGSI